MTDRFLGASVGAVYSEKYLKSKRLSYCIPVLECERLLTQFTSFIRLHCEFLSVGADTICLCSHCAVVSAIGVQSTSSEAGV